MAYITKEMKNKPEIVFSLVEEGFRENFSIWVKNMGTFVREGTLADKDGKVNDIKALKFMKKEKFSEHYPYPDFSRQTTYDYKVLIDGEEYMLPMKSTAKMQLEQIIGTLKATGQNPLTTKFKLSYTGTGISRRYKVEIVANSSQPQLNITLPQQQVSVPTKPIVILPLTEIETQLVNYIKANHPTIEFEQVKDSFLKYNITEDRARAIFKQEMGR